MNPPSLDHEFENLNCMEIWGGIEAAELSRRTPGLDLWIYSRPFEGARAGGDLHYLTLCGGGIVTRIVVADVSGHGVSVSEFSSILRRLLRKYINQKSQGRLVSAINQRFGEEVGLGLFATAVICTYLTSKNQLSVCNAGHPRPLFFRSKEKRWTILSGEKYEGARSPGAVNLPLGLDEETRYDQFTITLERGDVVVFYTDALIEATNDQGQLLGETGLIELANRIDPISHDPKRFGTALRDAVADYRGQLPPDDDLTLVVLKHTGAPAPRMSIAQKLDVYAKFFGLKHV